MTETTSSPSAVNGRIVLRMAIGAVHTERRHVEQAWQLLSGS